MQLTFDRRIGVAGVIVAFLGVGVTILWPDAKWLGWLCVLIGVAGLAVWMIAETRVGFGGTRLGRALTSTIAVVAVVAIGLALWEAMKPLGKPRLSGVQTPSPPGSSAQAPPMNRGSSTVSGEQNTRATEPPHRLKAGPHQAESKANSVPMPGNTNFVTVADRVKHIVVIQLQVSPNDVNPAADIETELGGDPLDKQEILMNLETEYNIVISDKDATNLHTVGDIISYIQKRTGSP